MSFNFEPTRLAFNFVPNTNFDLIYKHTTSHFERLNSTNVNNIIFLFFQFVFLSVYITPFIFSKFHIKSLFQFFKSFIFLVSIRFFKFRFIPLQYGYNTYIIDVITNFSYIMYMYIRLFICVFLCFIFLLFSDCFTSYLGLIYIRYITLHRNILSLHNYSE